MMQKPSAGSARRLSRDATAQNDLGKACATGEGAPRDQGQAARWFRKAADQGEAIGNDSTQSLSRRRARLPQACFVHTSATFSARSEAWADRSAMASLEPPFGPALDQKMGQTPSGMGRNCASAGRRDAGCRN
jgi:hypothetical protein